MREAPQTEGVGRATGSHGLRGQRPNTRDGNACSRTGPTAQPAHAANSHDHRTEAKNNQRPAMNNYCSTGVRTTCQQTKIVTAF